MDIANNKAARNTIININNIDQLMKEVCTGRSNSLRNIHEFGFNCNSILKIAMFAGKAKRISAVSYTTPLQEVLHLNTTDNDKYWTTPTQQQRLYKKYF